MIVGETFRFLDPGPLRDEVMSLALTSRIPAYPDKGHLPTYCFEMRVSGKAVGAINLRVGDSGPVIYYAGHIGYTVYPPFRGHHYAERACRLLLPLARAHGFREVWITANPDNYPSRRTCERLGATLIDIVTLPEENAMYQAGERQKCRYVLAVDWE